MHITSNQNPRFKDLLKLKEKKYRIKEKKFILEGRRIIEHGMGLGFQPLALFYDESREEDLSLPCQAPSYTLEKALFDRISDTVHSQGVIAVFDMNEINQRVRHRYDKAIILNGVSDPGNMGTILRTAEAFGFTKIYITKGSCDPYSDKVLRSTMGAIFQIELKAGFECPDLINYLKKEGYSIIASSLSDRSLNIEDMKRTGAFDPGKPYALVFGNEGSGIDEVFQEEADFLYKIPMSGSAESLNVAAAAAISLYTFSLMNL